MGLWNTFVNVLVVGFALFFAVIGGSFVLMPLLGTGDSIEGSPTGKGVLGFIFLLAAAPMLYYVFSKNARGLPPPHRKRPAPRSQRPPPSAP